SGRVAMHVLERRGMALLDQRLCRLMLLGSFGLLVLVLLPGFGVVVNGARRWFAAGPIQFQPSELMKISLVLYVARYLADHPKRLRSFRRAITPLLIAAGMPMRYMAVLAALGVGAVMLLALAQPYQAARLTSFLHPWSVGRSAGYQAVQGQIALGSGGLLGVGLGKSVQKIFYLPEAQTDF